MNSYKDDESDRSMARVRRKATAKARLNFEIAGIAAMGLAILLGIALASPERAGSAGAATARALHAVFGEAAGFFPVLVALFGAVAFLEVNLPRTIARAGLAAASIFLIIDASYATHGGVVGTALWHGLRRLFGIAGARVVLALLAVIVLVWISNISVKKAIGWIAIALSKLRSPKLHVALPRGHENLRQAFAFPAPVKQARVEALAPAIAEPLPVEPVERHDYETQLAEDETLEDDGPAGVAAAPEPEIAGDYEAPSPPSAARPRTYRLPDLALFDPPQARASDDSTRSHVLEDTLASFGVGAKVVHIERGPSITRYELKPERGVKISRIASLADDIALALAATSVRIEAPIPGKSAVGIEIPNKTISIVTVREILEALPQRGTIPPLWMALGKDITGRPLFSELGKMPHLLVAGATGSGKSVCLNTIIASLLVSATPDQVQMLMIDPKRVELTVYNGTPHLIRDVITDPRMAAGALLEMTKEMDARYERFARAGVRKIEEYNAKYPDEPLPYVLIAIDELADLMVVAPAKVETTIMRLAQLARATGIHLVVATQRPSVDVITGLIKANIPSRIAFAASSQVGSRTILDMAGAERLLGRGDMLYLPIDAPKPIRAQGALITGAEIHRLVHFWARQAEPENRVMVEVTPIGDEDLPQPETDPLCYEAAKYIIETNYASTAALQSQFSIGHPRAVRVMKQLEEFKVVGPHEGTKPRRILLGLSELERIAPRLFAGEGGEQDLFAAGG